MLNFTEKYMQMTQDKIIISKNKMRNMHSILLIAQDDKKFMDCGFRFKMDDWTEQIGHLIFALIELKELINPKCSWSAERIDTLLRYRKAIGPIRIRKIEKPNLIVFGSMAWSSEQSGDPEENKLQLYERKNKKDIILVMAVERDRPNCVISWHSNVEKKNGQLIITETSKQQNTDEEIEFIPEILLQSFKLFDEEDPIQARRPQH
jgi:hypothetical protein